MRTSTYWRPDYFRLGASFFLSIILHAIAIFNVESDVVAFGLSMRAGPTGLTVSLRQHSEVNSVPDRLVSSGLAITRPSDSAAVALTIAVADGGIPRPDELSDQRVERKVGGLVSPAPNASPFDGPWYYPVKYLHRLPVPATPITPVYPESAGGQQGRVEFELFLSATGQVDNLVILRAEPPGVFESAVVDAFGATPQAPGLITGYPVKSRLLIEVRFEPGRPATANIRDMEKYLAPVTRDPGAREEVPSRALRKH